MLACEKTPALGIYYIHTIGPKIFLGIITRAGDLLYPPRSKGISLAESQSEIRKKWRVKIKKNEG